MTDVKCPVCAGTCAFLDLVDGNRSCEEVRGFRRSPSDWQVAYYLCDQCGFCFAPEFSAWSSEDFRERIYNADYVRIDPDYLQLRPVANAQMLLDVFGSGAKIRHLDYGGGNGRLSARLVTAGWQSRSFDPFERPAVGLSDLETTFELITAFEVIEHVADPES